jgi:glycerol-3-phosphate cytidylyltransferase
MTNSNDNNLSKPKTVISFGVYDMLHIGHILLFKRAKELGNRLIVAVQDDSVIKKYKPEANLVYTTEERMYMVSTIRYVDEVVVYSDVDKDIQNIDFDIFAKGPDQVHAGFQRAVEWCKNNGKEVVVIPRTEGISSTMLREYSKTR